MTFNSLCKASNTMIIRVKVMGWSDNQRLFHFLSEYCICINIFYLSSTYLNSGSEGHVFKSPCQWAGYDCRLETTSGIAQTWTKSFLKQIIIATVFTCSCKWTWYATSLRHPGVWISLTFHIELLTDESKQFLWVGIPLLNSIYL